MYRTIELGDGWYGKVVRTQVYFSKLRHHIISLLCLNQALSLSDVFDGAMIVLAIWTLNFFHPSLLLTKAPANDTYVLASKRNSDMDP